MFTEIHQWKVIKRSVCWKPQNFLKLTKVSTHRAPFLAARRSSSSPCVPDPSYSSTSVSTTPFVWELNASTFAQFVLRSTVTTFPLTFAWFCVFGLISPWVTHFAFCPFYIMKQKEISTIWIARASLNTLCPELVRHLAVADVFVYVTP